ncbi:hypothetical protein BJ917_0802 [Pseudomonas sp. WPR_5_2]|nr:hypothetical protein BJ917_0802 [Pseudomonas sp. WPR_5_2]
MVGLLVALGATGCSGFIDASPFNAPHLGKKISIRISMMQNLKTDAGKG